MTHLPPIHDARGACSIRPATQEDAPALVGLAGAFRDHLQRAQPSDDQFATCINRLLGAEDAAFFLALERGRPVGYVLQRYRWSMWASGWEATLEDLFVDPALRRGGIGAQLVRFALHRAAARGCTSVGLDTNEHNTASTRIYTQLGFSAVSKRWEGRQLFFRLELRDWPRESAGSPDPTPSRESRDRASSGGPDADFTH